jgi:hypothetical protein
VAGSGSWRSLSLDHAAATGGERKRAVNVDDLAATRRANTTAAASSLVARPAAFVGSHQGARCGACAASPQNGFGWYDGTGIVIGQACL